MDEDQKAYENNIEEYLRKYTPKSLLPKDRLKGHKWEDLDPLVKDVLKSNPTAFIIGKKRK